MRKKTILLLFSCIFFSCENEEITGSKEMPDNELPVTVKFDLSLKGGLEMETEYLPMTRSTTDNVKTILIPQCSHKYVLLKNIEGSWYVDKIENFTIEGETKWIGLRTPVIVKQNGILSNLEMELRPGTYKLAVFLNADALDWKTDNIKEGDLVFKEGDPSTSYPRICKYIMNTTHAPEAIFLSWEIFTGMTNFTVGKNGDLHTTAPDRNIEVPLTRKVAEFQFLCKRDPEEKYYYTFIRTAYTLRATFHAKNGDRFCEGLNVLGQAYYNEETPLTHIGYYCNTFSLTGMWRTDGTKRIYLMPEINSTDFSIFFLADPENTQGVACEIEVLSMTGQSGTYPYNGFKYEGEPINRVLKANDLIGIAFECKKVESDPVIIQQITDGKGNKLSPEDYLLNPDYMWNQDEYVKPE